MKPMFDNRCALALIAAAWLLASASATASDNRLSLVAVLIAQADLAPASPAEAEAEKPLRFTITGYKVEGAKLVSQEDIARTVAPFIGPDKDFADIQYAIEAIEALYVERGFGSARVVLPEQELEQGSISLRIVETRIGKVTVTDNKFFSEQNVLAAVPSARPGAVPRAKQIAKELKLANENPSRQINVVLKAAENDEEVDANLVVTDSKPVTWGVSFDNTGAPETGDHRIGFSVRHANLFDRDHVGSLQYLTSPQYTGRVKVLGGSYKVPLYASGNSVEVFGGYSNVNSVVGGLQNFQGGGLLFSGRYNITLEKAAGFDQSVSLGVDWRDFKRIEQTNTVPPTVLFNEVVVTPISATYVALGKFDNSDLNGSASLSVNIPGANKGTAADFAAYDNTGGGLLPDPNYHVVRYSGGYSTVIGDDMQFRSALVGQWSDNKLVLGEQMRLGGSTAVRGFSEGSVGGDSGTRANFEFYSPDFGGKFSAGGNFKARALIFYDWGQTETNFTQQKNSISGAGLGLRLGFSDQFAFRLDWAQIINADVDPQQPAGKMRVHFALAASF